MWRCLPGRMLPHAGHLTVSVQLAHAPQHSADLLDSAMTPSNQCSSSSRSAIAANAVVHLHAEQDQTHVCLDLMHLCRLHGRICWSGAAAEQFTCWVALTAAPFNKSNGRFLGSPCPPPEKLCLNGMPLQKAHNSCGLSALPERRRGAIK